MNKSLENAITGLKPEVSTFYDEVTATFTYIVKDPTSNACAIVDSVLDLDYASGTVSHASADQVIDYVRTHNLDVEWHIETHVHADHLSAAPYLQDALGGKIAIASQVVTVQETFGDLFNEGREFKRDGSQFDVLLSDNQEYTIGNLQCVALHTPGHTPACMTHVMGDAAFIGDTMFMPDSGTARADFPGGDARTLYQSIQRILSLPDDTQLYMCHDYPEGRSAEYLTTVAEQRAANIHLGGSQTEDGYVKMREARDATLAMPTLIWPSLQVNMRAGHFRPPEDNDTHYFKVPISGIKPSEQS